MTAQLAIVATLKDGAEAGARALIEAGPPFDLAAAGFTRHTIFLSAGEVVFVFEAPEVQWRLDDLVDEPFGLVPKAFDAWRPLIDGSPRIGRTAFAWQRPAG